MILGQFNLVVQDLREKLSYILLLRLVLGDSSFNHVIEELLQLLSSDLILTGSQFGVVL